MRKNVRLAGAAVLFLVVILAVAVAPSQGVQELSPGDSQAGDAADAGPAAEPVSGEWIGGDPWLTWSRMTGDWNGWRSRLEQHAITVEGTYLFDFTKVESGGVRRKSTGRSLLEVDVTFDLEELLAVPDARLVLDFNSFTGRNASDDVGDFQFFSNIDLPENRHQLYELYYEQKLDGGRGRVKVGKMDANRDFAAPAGAGEFLSTSFLYSPTIPLPTYPDSATGVSLFFEPRPSIWLGGGLFDGAAQEGVPTGKRGPRTFLDDPSDLFLIGEVAGSWKVFPGQLDGRLAAGMWRHTGSFARFSGGSAGGTDGLYLVLDHDLWQEAGTGESEPSQGVVLSVQLGTADRKVRPVKEHYAVAVQWRGPVPSRDEDILGVGFTRAEFSDQAGSPFTESSEVSYELFYRIQVTPWLVVRPDLQYITDPGGDATLSDATVATVRFELSL